MKSPDVEADIQARKFLEQADYETGGPRRRYPAGKVKRYPEEDEGREFKIPQDVIRNLGKKKKPEGKMMAKGGSVSSASKRADGCAQRGKTKGRMI